MNHTSDNEDTQNRRRRQAVLKDRISDILELEGDLAILDLLNLAVTLWAERYPAKLSAAEKKKIQENYKGATPSLIAERAMSDEGLLVAMVSLTQMAGVVIDYSPKSHTKTFVEADATQTAAASAYTSQLQTAYTAATEAGLSTFGATTLMIVFGAMLGSKRGLPWPLVARPLVEMLSKVMGGDAPSSPAATKELEDRLIRQLMEQMGISRAEAKRYLAYAKAHKAS